MIDWSDAAKADLIKDLRDYSALIYSDSGYRKNIMHYSPDTFEILKKIENRRLVLEEILEIIPKKNYIKKYLLRRILDEEPLHIIAPKIYYKYTRLKWKYTEWKHRDDPEW